MAGCVGLSVLLACSSILYGTMSGRIAFTRDPSSADGSSADREIYTIRPDGTSLLRITQNDVLDDHASWQADGSRLTWYRDPSGGASDICVANYDGTNQSVLPGGANDVTPDFSPDGSRIAFTRVAGETLYTMTDTGGDITYRSNHGAYPDWHPGGNRILHVDWTSGWVGEMYVLDLTTGVSTRITTTATHAICAEPEWSPDGSRIAYGAKQTIGGPWDIWVMDADGSNPVNLTASWPSNEKGVSWSADGNYLAFASDVSGNMDIWVMDADGSNPYQVTNSPAFEGRPDWGHEIPEPTTMLGVFLGLGGLAGYVKRRWYR